MNARLLPLLLAASFVPCVVGCDKKEDKKEDAKGDDKKTDAKTDAKADDDAKDDGKEAEADEKAEEKKPKILACDQRDFIPEGDKKMAESLGKEAKPKLECIDYTGRTLPGEGSCAQGTPLETGCPDEDVIATCTLEKSGTVYKHYKDSNLNSAERMCKTLEGVFAKVE